MHPAFSVIFLTTLIGAGQGLFLALYTGQLYSAFKVLPVQDSAHYYALGCGVVLVLLVAGLFSSFFHLGRPERAWRAAARWRTSWLSREVIVLPAFTAVVAAWGLIHYLGWNPLLFTFSGAYEIDFSLLLGAIATLLCFTLFLSTGMIYACIKQLQEWATPLTVINYTMFGISSGFMLATAFATWQGSGLSDFFGGWAIFATIVAFVTRAQGSMAGSFNTREYFHGATKRKFKFVKWVFLVLVFPVPLLLLSIGLGTEAISLLLAAFLVQYVGLLAERWFFFAQANHPQNLYYQTV